MENAVCPCSGILFGQTPARTQSSQEPEDLAVTTPILQSRQLRLRGNDVTCQGDHKELGKEQVRSRRETFPTLSYNFLIVQCNFF